MISLDGWIHRIHRGTTHDPDPTPGSGLAKRQIDDESVDFENATCDALVAKRPVPDKFDGEFGDGVQIAGTEEIL
jgi:hypothetical protein